MSYVSERPTSLDQLRELELIRRRLADLEVAKAKTGRKPKPVSTAKIPYCPNQPTGQQQQFLALTCREALYGGAAGGGKSDAILMAALQYVEHPHYACLILRRTYADLSKPGALMDRAGMWLRPTAARWDNNKKTWLFPSGAKVTFGYMASEGDKYNYQGAEYQAVFYDELTQFSESMYTYLFSRQRKLAGSTVPLRMRSASNPGGLGHDWVKQRFLLDGPQAGRVFVPAKLSDNPHVDQESYLQGLMELDPITRQQLLEGDWDVRPEGALFKREWFEIVGAGPA